MTEYDVFAKADEYLRKKYGDDYVQLRSVIDYLVNQAREEAIEYSTGYD